MNQTVLEKIKKLLRMKRGGTPDEVATALDLARRLAEKHGIDLSQVNEDEQWEPITEATAYEATRLPKEVIYASLVVQEFYNVLPLHHSGWSEDLRKVSRLKLIGTASDIEIATYILQFLVGHFRRCWSKRDRRIRKRDAFMYGLYCGIMSKLLEGQRVNPANEAGLVIRQRGLARRKAFMAERFGETTNRSTAPRNKAQGAMNAGWAEGRKTNIRSGLNGTPVKAKQLAGS